MIRLSLASLLGLCLFSCNMAATGQYQDDHWDMRSIVPRANRYFLGYDAARDGEYRDFAYGRKQDLELTFRRHFFNHNPDNPNHPEVPSRYEPRPNNSLLPNPVRYIHLEGVLLGFAVMPLVGGFVPLPLDSILGTVDHGGWDEFWGTVDRSLDEGEVVTASVPPALGVKGEDVIISTVTQTGK